MSDDLWRKKIEDYRERLAGMTPRERFKDFIIRQTYSHDMPHAFDPDTEDGWTEIPDDKYPAVVDREIDAYRAEVLREAVQQIRDEADSVDIPGSSFTPSVVHGMKYAADFIEPDPDTP